MCLLGQVASLLYVVVDRDGFEGCPLRVTLIPGIPNVIIVGTQVLTYICEAHAGVNGFATNLADVPISVIGFSHLSQGICDFVSRYTTMAWNPHKHYFASSLCES